MSVGTSSDIKKVSILCRDVYRKCREAGVAYEEIRREVRGLHGVLRELKEEGQERDGERDEGIWDSVNGIIRDCEGTLRQLDGLLGRYGRNGSGRLGSNEMDQLGGIRVRLISHKKNISHILDSLLHEDEDGDAKDAEELDGKGELDMLLDKVDDIAADGSQRAGTIQMMGSENEDEEDNMQIWKWFRRNLIEEGVHRGILERHKDVLIAYIRQMEQDGLLVENPSASAPTPRTSPMTSHKERWDSAHSESSHTQGPPASFNNININSGRNDPGAKEMIQREDNIKFPPSMKFQRPKPESLVDSYTYPGRNMLPTPHRQLSPPLTPKISTTDLDMSESNSKKDIDGSKLNSEDNTSLTRQTTSRYPINSNNNNTSIIQTSDLLLLPCFTTTTPQLLPPSSPGSWNSNSYSYSYPNEPLNGHLQSQPQLNTMTLRPKHSSDPVQKSSPRTSGVRFDLPDDTHQSSKVHTPAPSNGNNTHDSAIPIPIPTSSTNSRIAPDSSGHEIPPDAKWTKVKRSLISPEVLVKDGRRFEARPEFVAILGILTKEEIQQYAERSHILREERWWRNHPEQRERRERKERRERSERSRRRNSEDEESSCSSNSSSEMSSDSDSDSDTNEHRRRGDKRNKDARGKERRGDEWKEKVERGEGKGRSERYNRRERDREANYTFAPQSQSQPQPQHFSSSPYPAWNNSLPGRGMDIPGTNQTPNGYPPLGSFPGQQNYPQQGYPPPPQQPPPYPTQNPFPQPPYSQGQGPPPQINPNQYLSPNPYAPYSTSPSSSSPTYPPSSTATSPYTNINPHTYTPNPSYRPHTSRRHHSHSHSRSPHSHHSHSHSHSRRSRDSDPRSSEPRRQNSGSASTSTGTGTSKWRDHLAAAGIGGGLGGAAAGLWEVLSEAAEGF